VTAIWYRSPPAVAVLGEDLLHKRLPPWAVRDGSSASYDYPMYILIPTIVVVVVVVAIAVCSSGSILLQQESSDRLPGNLTIL
jgi:hypothetical protein